MLVRAEFEPFVWHDHGGRVRFVNDVSGVSGRFRERVWPAFRRAKRGFPPRMWATINGLRTFRHERVTVSIVKAGRVNAARRWIPMNPLVAHQMRVEDSLEYWRQLRR